MSRSLEMLWMLVTKSAQPKADWASNRNILDLMTMNAMAHNFITQYARYSEWQNLQLIKINRIYQSL